MSVCFPLDAPSKDGEYDDNEEDDEERVGRFGLELCLGKKIVFQVLRKSPFFCKVRPLKGVKKMPGFRQDLVVNSLTLDPESEGPRLRTFDMESEFERPESAAYLVLDLTSCNRSAAPIGASLTWWFHDLLICTACHLSAGIFVIGDTGVAGNPSHPIVPSLRFILSHAAWASLLREPDP